MSGRLSFFFGKMKIKMHTFLSNYKRLAKYLFVSQILIIPIGFYFQPQHIQPILCKQIQLIASSNIPLFLRPYIYRFYAYYFKVDLQEVELPLQQYQNLAAFFTRKIKARQFEYNQNTLISPCDSKILSVKQVISNNCLLVKDIQYSLTQLLLPNSKDNIKNFQISSKNKLYQVVFYLNPGNYHRFHSPANIQIKKRKDIQGKTHSVAPNSLTTKTYAENARISLFSTWKHGFLALSLVGALNVSKINVYDKQKLMIGEQFGYFNLGSTIVLIFEAPEIKWMINQGQQIKYGQAICQIVNS